MRILVALVSALALTLLPAMPAQAAPAATSKIVGTWKGESSGYEGGVYVSRELRWTITKSKGPAFTGTKSWRDVGGKWSAPEVMNGVLLSNGEVRWADEDGTFLGMLDGGHISGTYLEPGSDSAAFSQHLKKVK